MVLLTNNRSVHHKDFALVGMWVKKQKPTLAVVAYVRWGQQQSIPTTQCRVSKRNYNSIADTEEPEIQSALIYFFAFLVGSKD